jgi:hypothetical protein
MRGVSIPTHEYSRVAESWLQSRRQRYADSDSTLEESVLSLTASTRAYTRVVLRLRAQAEAHGGSLHRRNGSSSEHGHLNTMSTTPSNRASTQRNGVPHVPSSRAPSPSPSIFSHSQHNGLHSTTHRPTPAALRASFNSPLFRPRRAPLLHVFVPSPDGDWLSDATVLECEAELRRAGVLHLLRIGDAVWDAAVGDEGNLGRMLWDGSYLIVCASPPFVSSPDLTP